MNLLLSGDEIGLNSCVPLSAGVDLFAEDSESSFLVFALFSNGTQALAAFGEVGLQLGFFEGKFLQHRLQFCTASCVPDCFGQFCCTFADLMLQFVDPAHEAFSTRLRFFPLGPSLGEVDLHRVQLTVSFFQRRGVLLAGFSGFSGDDLSRIFLFLKCFDLGGQHGFLLVESVKALLGFFQFATKSGIDSTHGLISHHRQGFCDLSTAGVEFEFRTLTSKRFQTCLKTQQVVQHRFEGGLSGFGTGSDGGQVPNESRQGESFHGSGIGRDDRACREANELHFSLCFGEGEHRLLLRVH